MEAVAAEEEILAAVAIEEVLDQEAIEVLEIEVLVRTQDLDLDQAETEENVEDN